MEYLTYNLTRLVTRCLGTPVDQRRPKVDGVERAVSALNKKGFRMVIKLSDETITTRNDSMKSNQLIVFGVDAPCLEIDQELIIPFARILSLVAKKRV